MGDGVKLGSDHSVSNFIPSPKTNPSNVFSQLRRDKHKLLQQALCFYDRRKKPLPFA